MSPKIILWLVFTLISGTWYALDPAAGGPFFSAPTHAVDTTIAALTIPWIAGN